MIKQSIHTKILRVTLIMLFVLAISIGSASVLAVYKLSSDNSQQIMRLICDKETQRFDNKLTLLEHSVETIYDYAYELRTGSSSGMDVLSDEYCEMVSSMALSIAERTDGAVAVYFRYNPDIVGSGTAGFFWTKMQDGNFCRQTPTDILLYDAKDSEHVGWYYAAKNAGKPIWMSPYNNKNLDIFMISYIIPVYIDDTFVGLIGMDIDFNNIMALTGEIELYETGSVSLVSLSDHIVYYFGIDRSSWQKTLSTELYNHMTTINGSDKVLKYTDEDGTVSAVCSNILKNGMRLLVSVPLSEINEKLDSLLTICIVTSVIIFIVSVAVVMNYTSRIVEPLKQLTNITRRYAKGKWDRSYICATGDELQVLSESIAAMAETTQSYIGTINAAARTDSLTGLKNKACYTEYVEQLCAENKSEYAVVVCDLNYLKRANDNYGHEAGDKLLYAAGRFIGEVFSHSPVFRIGGDEFVALLTGRDYDLREELMERLNSNCSSQIEEFDGVSLSIACGIASAPRDGEEYEDLFNLADKRMYERKKEMKAIRTD